MTRSFEVAPLASALNSILGGRYTTSADYWRLPEEARAARSQSLRVIAPEDRAGADLQSAIANYEVHHTPLYYLVAVPVYWLCAPLDLPSRVFCLRFFSLLLGSISLFAAYGATRHAFAGRWESRTLLFILALMPMFINTTARISNDALAVPLASLAVFLVIDYFAANPNGRRAAQIGIVLGLGLLSKAYFLAIVGAACALFVISLFSAADRNRRLRHIAVVIALAAGISSWWYARNYVLYGNLSGLQELTLTANLSVGERLDLARAVPWQAAWHIMFKQHIWLGNMSLMEFSRAIYNWGYGLILLSICGLLYAGFEAARRWTRSDPAQRGS